MVEIVGALAAMLRGYLVGPASEPEGGGRGGRVVAAGTPETIAAVTEGYTGRYLRDAMEA